MIEYPDNEDYNIGEVGCSLPDLRFIVYALAGIVLVAALAIVIINKMRLW